MKTALKIAAFALAAAGPAAAGDPVTYTAGDMVLEGYEARAEAPKGTVVILPTWNGVSDFEKDRARMLAAMGYDALAADLHGKGALPATMEAKEAALKAFFADEARMHAILGAALDRAASYGSDKIVVMGYSMGGGAAIDIGRSGLGAAHGVDAYAIFSGRVSDPGGRMIPEGMAPVFVAHGDQDPRVPASSLINFEDDLDMAGVAHTITVYPGAGHLFSAPGFPSYDAALDRDSWDKLGTFLTETLSGEGAM